MPKTIAGSVGRGGRNYPASDVMTVQYLLNCVPATQGGPTKELAVDGAAGPKTIGAIEGFQRKLGGFADGRVDPGGATLRALQARDPRPNEALGAGAAKGAGPFAKGGGPGSNTWGAGGGMVDPGFKGGRGPGSKTWDPGGGLMDPGFKTGAGPGSKTWGPGAPTPGLKGGGTWTGGKTGGF